MKMVRRLLLPALLALCVLPATAGAVEPGIVIGANTTVADADKTAESGARWVRIFVDWSVFDENDLAARLDRFERRGINTLVVVSYKPAHIAPTNASKITPPSDPGAYGNFIEYLGKRFGSRIDAYEMWNEPDENIHFAGGPRPEAYVPLLQQGYNAVQRTDPDATVVTGGMVGNDFGFLDAIYKLGGKGYFDAVGVHTDLACESDAPEFQYRDEQGRIGRYVFTGYREVAATMADHGERKPIWMTEMGWPTPGDGVKCLFLGKPLPGKEDAPGGVSLAQQAEFLTRGFQCMQGDGLVSHAFWFSLQDISRSTTHEDRFGLIDAGGAPKPSFAALQAWSKARSATGQCGEPVDRTPPSVDLQFPPDDFAFAGPLAVKAQGMDNLRVSRMELFVDGKPVGGSRAGDRFLLDPWFGARDLPRGPHKLTVKAYDGAKNVGQRSITVRRVAEAEVSRSLVARLDFKAKKKRRGKVYVCASVSAAPDAAVPPTGKVRVFMDKRRGGRWHKYTKLTATVANGLCLTRRLRTRGKWKIYARYVADAPYKRQTSKALIVRWRR
jgi:hypothetical protein